MRVLFGDRKKILNKFMTCIRVRPYPEQKIPTEFYVKEHCELLFNKNKILNLKFYILNITVLMKRFNS